MSLFKCKMCGGSLEVEAGATVIECEYCGTQQTLPKLDDDRRANMYDRANHFRRNNDFDKAMGIYENILNEDGTDAEAYWSLVLCRYGIEYVEDPASHKRIPTVNRAQFTSIYDDDNYKSALQYADSYQKRIYEEEARAINEIQKGILAISQKEEPFDVFICYKESDNTGRRTPDSVLAQELYYGLKDEGFKVFFARITLEDKLGSAYEPYIFAALNSAMVMVTLGTKPEYFNAVWVKNEWSRYLALIKQGQKKMLIPAYKDMDPYDLPEEFSHLQAQDMSKLGFMQDLIRGIKKIVAKDEPKPVATVVEKTVVKETVAAAAGGANVDSLLKRVFMFLEDGDWKSANEYCEKVLDIDPENAQAYLGKLMADLRVKKRDEMKDYSTPFDNRSDYQKVLRFGDEAMKKELQEITQFIKERNEQERLLGLYNSAVSAMNAAKTEEAYKKAAEQFAGISQYKDATELRKKCLEKAEIARKDAILNEAKAKEKNATIPELKGAITLYKKIPGWKDADESIAKCQRWIDGLTAAEAEADRIAERQAEIAREKAKRIKIITIIAVPCFIALAIILCFVGNRIRIKNLIENGDYSKVIDVSDLTSITIPNGVTTIGDGAFKGCKSLTSITIPDGVMSIGYNAFYGCDSLTSITIPDSVTSIGDDAFHGCYNLTSITIPDGVTSICAQTFYCCTALTSITIPDGVTSIGYGAFFGCDSLTNITIPDSVTIIGKNAFNGCDNLTSIIIPDSVTRICEAAFEGCDGLTSITIPAGVTSIEYRVFALCDGLTSITIPDSVTSIGYGAFSNCDSLTTIIIPDSVTSIGNFAFEDCDGLTSITIPDGVWGIGTKAFEDCDGLTSITIPDSVTSIGSGAFDNCDSLTTIIFEGTKGQWNAISKGWIRDEFLSGILQCTG